MKYINSQITLKLNLPEPGEYGVDIYASESKKKKNYTYACQYLVLYLADEEKSPFVEEICRGQALDETESGNTSYLEEEKEVGIQVLSGHLLHSSPDKGAYMVILRKFLLILHNIQ